MRKFNGKRRLNENLYNGFVMSMQPDGMSDITNGMTQQCETNGGDECEYTEEELKLTKRYVEMIGGCERASQLIDRVGECEDCLKLIDDGESEIDVIAASVPEDVDMPAY